MQYEDLKDYLTRFDKEDAIAALEDGELLGKLGVSQEVAENLHSELSQAATN